MNAKRGGLKFTQEEVRHIVCVLTRNSAFPPDVTGEDPKRFGSNAAEWRATHERVKRKFLSIDRRFNGIPFKAERTARANTARLRSRPAKRDPELQP